MHFDQPRETRPRVAVMVSIVAPTHGGTMRLLLRLALLASFGCLTQADASPPPSTDGPAARVATFSCADSLPRADGAPLTTAQCKIVSEYCFEASGGPPLSHGAQCRQLPKGAVTCADLIALHGAGTSCSGTQANGLRVQFAFP